MNSNPHHYQIPAEPGRLRALGLAVLVHLLLLGFLWFGVSWQSDTPVAVEAEIWSPVAREAAPPPPPPPPPEPVPEPPKATPVPPPPVVEPEPVQTTQPDPDIAIEKEKEKKKKQEKEEAERLKKEKLAEQKAREEEEKRKKVAEKKAQEEEKRNQLAEEEEKEKKKLAEEKKRKEEAAAEEKKKLAEEQQRKQEEAAAEQRARKRREDDLRRQLGGDGGAGDAQKSQGSATDISYLAKIGGLIKSNTNFVQRDYQGNPAVKFLIELQPDGQLRGEPRLLQSSGLPTFDSAVKRAIEKSAPFPKNPATGKVPDESIEITQRPKDTDNR